MVVEDFTAAQIRLILASNDKAQAAQLLRDMRASKYFYGFALHNDSKTLLETVEQRIAEPLNLPTVLIINYKFAAKQCEALLRLARTAAKDVPIECVVTHPPADPAVRAQLTALGATLYDEGSEIALPHVTVH